ISGLRSSEVMGRVVFDLFPRIAQRGAERVFRDALNGQSTDLEDGSSLFSQEGQEWAQGASFLPWRDERGDAIGGIGVLKDNTLVQESERRFRIMADAARVLLWMSGPDTLCTFFNQTWLEFTGRKIEEELGEGWAAGVHPEDWQTCLDIYFGAFHARRV